ncbi:uncharacterized protein F5Z01DRAFT_665330 [Emericellopsis atlantica]|uniref:Cytidyltransferase-like domain-containing protein n=1 Tax=Emericellopsis atlantica TaxID=2614577 RepID=A0A9P7ZEI1_9HYPO|nr:uncharacterized protein F5Z01DRAFT_665330 [Emericellopsis atlantica]KAG9250614.1 hypothetical protein F5Z01DRAFT_665330 [Emericellopsis atlantica]
MESTADLGCYIEDCHFQGSYSIHQQIFDQGITHSRPQLQRNRRNRILLYPGSFNPPHQAHQELLYQAFSRSQDLNVIAAIVILLDDEDVAQKCQGSRVFTKDQRVRLWRGEYVPHDWLWVYDRSVEEWGYFRQRLTLAICRDGFDIGFTVLLGPDHIRRTFPPHWGAWDCDEILVGNAGRVADFTSSHGRLLRIEDCEDWEAVVENEDQMHQRALRTVAWCPTSLNMLGEKAMSCAQQEDPSMFGRLLKECLLEYFEQLEGVKVCHRKQTPKQWIRFIPTTGDPMHISSTRIRHLLATCPREKLYKNLRSLALHPEMLRCIFPEFANIDSMKLWTNRVKDLRSIWSFKHTTTQSKTRIAYEIGRVCFNGWNVPEVALLLLSFKNRTSGHNNNNRSARSSNEI